MFKRIPGIVLLVNALLPPLVLGGLLVLAYGLLTTVEQHWIGTCLPGQLAEKDDCVEGLKTTLEEIVGRSEQTAAAVTTVTRHSEMEVQESLDRFDRAQNQLEETYQDGSRLGESLRKISLSYSEPSIIRKEIVEAEAIFFDKRKVDIPIIEINPGQLKIGEVLVGPFEDVYAVLGATLEPYADLKQVVQELESLKAVQSETGRCDSDVATISKQVLALAELVSGVAKIALWVGAGLIVWFVFAVITWVLGQLRKGTAAT